MLRADVVTTVHLSSDTFREPPNMAVVLEAVGQEAIKYLRSYTSERRPSATAGGPDRPAHPGHWADISHDLADSYGYEVSNPTTLKVFNTSGHAKYLEWRDGYFVIRGIMDPGGLIQQVFERIAKGALKGWTVTIERGR